MRRRDARAPLVAGLACAVLCGAALLPRAARSQAASTADPLGALLSRLAQVPGMEARFREEKHIALLARPLVNEGTLHFAPPGRLARHTVRPARSSLLLQDGRLVVGDASGSRALDLEASPVLRAMVDPFVGLLAGDRRALERAHTIAFHAPADDPEAWTLVLRPKAATLRRVLRDVRAQGRGVVLERIVVRERSGDRSETTLTQMDVRRRYGRAELARVFRVPGNAR